MNDYYFADLPQDQTAPIRRLAQRYRGLIPGLPDNGTIPDHRIAVELAAMTQLENEIDQAYLAWLERIKTAIERSGREYNRRTFLEYINTEDTR